MVPRHKTPEFLRAIASLGGVAAGVTKRNWPSWKRSVQPTRMALERHYPNHPALSMDLAAFEDFCHFVWEVGYRAGLGRKRR